MQTASEMQVEASQKQARGKAEGNGVLLCVCFALRERKAVTRYGLLCSALLSFVLFCSCEGELSDVSICFALLCFALHGSALLCIAHLWNDKKRTNKMV